MIGDAYRRQRPVPAAKSLGVLLNRAAWLGKGQRPESRVTVPEIVATVNEEQAANEKMIEEESIMAEIESEIEAAAPIEEAAEPEPELGAVPAALPAPVLPLAAVVEESPARPMPLTVPVERQVKISGEEVTVTMVKDILRGAKKN